MPPRKGAFSRFAESLSGAKATAAPGTKPGKDIDLPPDRKPMEPYKPLAPLSPDIENYHPKKLRRLPARSASKGGR